jgi:hypothetical protein
VEQLAFYCVCDRNHFLGLVGLINSLRIVGHHETVYVLDCGLEQWQRELLEPEAVLAPSEREAPPYLLKHALPLERPAEVMVLADVDIIFTNTIRALVTQAEQTQKPVLFLNDRTDRFHREWDSLGFGAPVPHPYVATGQFVLPLGPGMSFLGMFEQGLRRLDVSRTLVNPRARPTDPFYYPEMDVLNAMVGTAFPLDSFTLAARTTTSYWPFPGLRVEDAQDLRCAFADRRQPLLLHHIMTKPWEGVVAPNAYTQLLTRLLCEPDVAVKVPMQAVPHSLRRGLPASLVRHSLGLRVSLRSRLRGKLGIRARLASRRLPAPSSSPIR